MRKYVKTENFEANIDKALKFFEGLLRDDIIDYSSGSDVFYKLGYQVDTHMTKIDGSITLKWVY